MGVQLATEAFTNSISVVFCFLRSPEQEDPGEAQAGPAVPGWTRSLERGSVSSDLYSNVSFLNLDVGI